MVLKQALNPNDVFPNKKKARIIIAFVIDETMIQIGDTDAWLWITIEPVHNRILGAYISRHRNRLSKPSILDKVKAM